MLESRILEKRDRREGMNGTIFQIAVGRHASKLNPCLALKALLPVPMVHSFFCAYPAGSSCRMRSLWASERMYLAGPAVIRSCSENRFLQYG